MWCNPLVRRHTELLLIRGKSTRESPRGRHVTRVETIGLRWESKLLRPLIEAELLHLLLLRLLHLLRRRPLLPVALIYRPLPLPLPLP